MDLTTSGIAILLSVALVPHLTAIIVETNWSGGLKGITALVLSIILALIVVYSTGHLDWQNAVATTGIIAVVAHFFYESISKGFDQELQAKISLFGGNKNAS